MLPKTERLSVGDIKKLTQGKNVFGNLISLRFIPAHETKFSILISKKTAKQAVKRNRIKRRIYSAVKTIKKSIKKPFFIILTPKKEIILVSFNDLKKELTTLFNKAGIL